MASEKLEDPMNNTAGTEDETIAQRRKRLRRVSFADREITSIHIFNRDEDYETPPNSSASKPQSGEQADTSESEDKVIRFFGELADSEDTEGDGDAEDEAVVDKIFLRPKGSPSSGGSTIGSATTDDEDNFFGPVSSNFIKPGRLSDTSISEEHLDITMDSTAFSMHFRSLAMSESGDVRTPTSSHLPVEEKTPTQVTSRSDAGSAMLLTKPKKLFPKSPPPLDKESGGRDSDDMSLVGENSRRYDYGHISPTLAALLADESKELLPASSDFSVEARSSGVHDSSLPPQNGCIPIAQAYSHGIDSSDACATLLPHASASHPQIELQESGSQHHTKEAYLPSSTVGKQSESIVGMFPQSLSCVTPSPRKGGSFMSAETLALVQSLSTIQKSKSRLGLIPSPFGSALSQRTEKSKLQLYHSMSTPSTIGREEIGFSQEKHADIPISNLADLLSKDDNRTPVSEKKDMQDQHNCGAFSPAGDISDVFANISPEGNTNFAIEGSLLKQQERNLTASIPEKCVSSLANCANATTSASKNCVTLHGQEHHCKTITKSETGYGNMTEDCASENFVNTLPDKVDSLLAESGLLLSETGFSNGSAQHIEKDSVLNKNKNRNISAAQFLLKDKNHFNVHREMEVISAEDFPAVVTVNLPCASGSSSIDRSKNEASPAKGPSGLKSKAKDVDHLVKLRSPKVGKTTHYISNPVMDHPNGSYHANDCSVVHEQVVNWTEIPGKISIKINQMVALLANKLNPRLICKLEDIVTHLTKVYLCEVLCLQIQSQKAYDDLTGAKKSRRAESRSSLCKLAYAKAKLELLHLKQEIMMKKCQAVSTGVQTSEKLMLNCARLLRQYGFHSTGLFNPEQAHEVTTSKVAEITQEIKVLDSKIEKFINCFSVCDKMTGDLAYADTIMKNLKKKMSCGYIRQDMLVWKVDSLGEMNDCQSLVLNYIGLINQRLTLKPGCASCVLVSNSMSETFIKHFPEMNVSTAFNSLFNAECSRKYVGGSNILLEITQKTSLVLHNLLDVAEEFQLARMEIPNLVQGNFESPSAEQLDLQISFIGSTNLRKVTIILDVTCLTHGSYPGEIIPRVSGTKRDGGVWKALIESAMDDVGVGYPRILRLCRCISNVLQSQSRASLI